MERTVLIVDDMIFMRSLIKDNLEENGYHIVGEAANGRTAIALVMELKPDLITLDIDLPDMTGIDVLRVIKKEKSMKSKVIMTSLFWQEFLLQSGLKLGADDYLTKPFTGKELVASANKIFE